MTVTSPDCVVFNQLLCWIEMPLIENMLVVWLSVIVWLSKVRIDIIHIFCDSHLSGTSQTVLFSSTLWKPDFMALTAAWQRQGEFYPAAASTRPTKYNCWAQLTAGGETSDATAGKGHQAVRTSHRLYCCGNKTAAIVRSWLKPECFVYLSQLFASCGYEDKWMGGL